ncbi:MAG: hypothetical protein ONB27_15645 [candidate division KSB1 bacterium]|nr:hypothetical protein [candidate division KSB1 bacterium]
MNQPLVGDVVPMRTRLTITSRRPIKLHLHLAGSERIPNPVADLLASGFAKSSVCQESWLRKMNFNRTKIIEVQASIAYRIRGISNGTH